MKRPLFLVALFLVVIAALRLGAGGAEDVPPGYVSAEQLEEADALVLFDPRTDLRRRGGVTLPLYDEAAPMRGLSLPPALEERLPEGADRGQLLSALLEVGVLRPGQVSASASPGSAAGNTALNA